MAAAERNKFRMAALDLDGTLLNSDHALSPATIDGLRRLHSKGFAIAIATGRSAACAARVVEALDLPSLDGGGEDGGDGAGFPLVCTNGARGVTVRRAAGSDVVGRCADHPSEEANPFLRGSLVIGEEMFHHPLPPELTLRTLALAHGLGCVTNYYHGHRIYAVVRDRRHLELTQRYAKLTGSEELYCYLNATEEEETEGKRDGGEGGDPTDLYNEDNAYGYRRAVELGPPSKLLILCDTEKLDEITDFVRAELNGTASTSNDPDDAQPRQQREQQQQAHVIRGAPPFFVEILRPAVHKGRGLLQLCDSLSIPLEEVVAFGDGDNDLEFVKMAGWGVAMKNGREVLKGAADEVTEWTNDEVSGANDDAYSRLHRERGGSRARRSSIQFFSGRGRQDAAALGRGEAATLSRRQLNLFADRTFQVKREI